MTEREYKQYKSIKDFSEDIKSIVELSMKIKRKELVYAVRALMENNAELFGMLSPDDVRKRKFENAYVSEEAYKVIKAHLADEKFQFEKLGLKYEHVVPAKEIYNEMVSAVENNKFNEDWFEKFVKDHFVICVVTNEENTKLSKAGYKSSMPKGWKLDDDSWARYNADEIKISCKKYSEYKE